MALFYNAYTYYYSCFNFVFPSIYILRKIFFVIGAYSVKVKIFFTLLFNLVIFNFAVADTSIETQIEIDTSKLQLAVMREGNILLLIKDISIGRFGSSRIRIRGSNITPIGTFKISSIRKSQNFYKFFALEYPNRENADLALQENRIDFATWEEITKAIDKNRPVPQNTLLGGHLGIHGIGKGDIDIHRRYNWTNGCIAITNEQIDQLSHWVRPGMRVTIF